MQGSVLVILHRNTCLVFIAPYNTGTTVIPIL